MSFELPKLPYSYEALEPHIDASTMKIHHSKHHAGYTSKLNAALENYPDIKDNSIEALLDHLDEIPEDIRTAVRNNGGGYANHNLYWRIMSPDGGGEPDSGELLMALDDSFGGFDTFKEKFTEAAASHFGSGWAWLVLENEDFHICTTPNQDSPLMKGNVPLLGIDVWEHAYYLKHQNKRAEYIMSWWNVVNWKEVEKNLLEGRTKK